MKCSIPGCLKKHMAKKLCSMHYQRLKQNGDPKVLGHASPGSGFKTSTGYWAFEKTINGKRIVTLEHRKVWQEFNGQIPDGVIVHHKNENKLDNRIENLQLITKSEHNTLHHSGKRKPSRKRPKASSSF
jgi:hypothetical protein